MLTIALDEVRIYAYHGYFPEETIIGNEFIVDVSVQIPAAAPVDDLAETVNYQGIFAVIQTVMAIPKPLLEEVVYDISAALRQRYPAIRRSTVSLRKVNPPMGASIRNSRVVLEKEYV